jgi:aspartate aminotransferase
MRARFQERRDLVVSLMGEIEGISFTQPLAAFYVFFNVSKFFGKKTRSGEVIRSAEEICTTLLEDFGIALVAGNAFGDPNSVRLSFAASEVDIREGLNRIKAGLSSLA